MSGATVSVNGVNTTTSARGWFSVSVPPAKPDRYVMNVTHPQYALLSRIHDKAIHASNAMCIQTLFHNLHPPLENLHHAPRPFVEQHRRSRPACLFVDDSLGGWAEAFRHLGFGHACFDAGA